ncbi:MAG: hypothetical protein WC521_01720 [Bdellovibrionales bacterium]|jgi:hypothetical protein
MTPTVADHTQQLSVPAEIGKTAENLFAAGMGIGTALVSADAFISASNIMFSNVPGAGSLVNPPNILGLSAASPALTAAVVIVSVPVGMLGLGAFLAYGAGAEACVRRAGAAILNKINPLTNVL